METINDILNDIGNFSLVLFGITATLFTVIYSFIINKREYLKEISDKVKSGEMNPILSQRKSNAIKYIKSMKKMNFQLIISLFASLFLSVIAHFFKYAQIECFTKKIILILIGFLTFLLLIQLIYILTTTVRKYHNETKI